MKIAVGNSRMDKKWKNQDISWADLCARCGSTIRTTETVEEYRKLKKGQQDGIKDVGGFVGGHLREGRRKNGMVLCRSLLTLDMDYGTPDTAPSKLPSFQAMSDVALKDEKVKAAFAEERKAQANEEFSDEDWQNALELDKTGKVKNTLQNLTVILMNDPLLKPLVFNQLLDGMEIKGDVPWRHPSKFWRDADDAQLISYVDSLLPEDWDGMDIFERRNFLTGSDFGGIQKHGTVKRTQVSNKEQ